MCFTLSLAQAFMHHSFFVTFTHSGRTGINTLSLHDALPIWCRATAGRGRVTLARRRGGSRRARRLFGDDDSVSSGDQRSEEHTSELQSRQYIVCRLLLEKKKNHRWL